MPGTKALNPFMGIAAEAKAAEERHKSAWEAKQHAWRLHLEACKSLLSCKVKSRLDLAAEAAQHWGYEVVVEPIKKTENHTGRVYLRVRMSITLGYNRYSRLEFVLSPESKLLAAEASRVLDNRRWKTIGINEKGLTEHVDLVIREFLIWGVCAPKA